MNDYLAMQLGNLRRRDALAEAAQRRDAAAARPRRSRRSGAGKVHRSSSRRAGLFAAVVDVRHLAGRVP